MTMKFHRQEKSAAVYSADWMITFFMPNVDGNWERLARSFTVTAKHSDVVGVTQMCG